MKGYGIAATHAEAVSLTDRIRLLENMLVEREREIQRLSDELQALRQRAWATDACGDDLWDLD
ncbi:MAG: hypothetical protein RDA78_00200 [Roseibium sp.]|uniref:hypothetical protein n=1 Tax=Roseibium sp. TaxID=1936156 RepID=UPI003D9C1727